MLKGLFFKKQSIIFTWLSSYVLILVIPVLISGAVYIKTLEVLEEEISNSNYLHLKRVQNQMDSIFYDVERFSNEIALNTRTYDLLKLTGNADQIPGFTLYQAVADLNSFRIPQNSIDDFYIYYKNIDLVLSGYTARNSMFFYDTYIRDTGVPYETWKNLISGQYKNNYTTAVNTINRGKNSKSIIFVKTIPLNVIGNNSANIIISLDRSSFMSSIQDIGDIEAINKGTVFVVNDINNLILASNPQADMDKIDFKVLNNSGGTLHMSLGDQKSVVSYVSSQLNNWKYIVAVPYSLFWEKSRFARSLTLVGLGLCLLVGGFITYMSLRRNYNPVNALVKLLETSQGLSLGRGDNEYQFIRQVVNKIHEEHKKTDSILKQQNKELKSELLTRLLKGKVGGNLPVTDALVLHDIHFQSDFFAVMAFYVEDYSEVFPDEPGQPQIKGDFEKFKMVQFIMTNIIEEMIVGNKNMGFMTDIDDTLVCLVNLNETSVESAREDLLNVTLECQNFVYTHFKINFLIGISDTHRTLAGIPQAYSEALQTIEYKKVLGIEEISHYRDITGMPKGDYYYPLEMEQQLINLIKSGDFDNSMQVLDEIFRKNFQSSVLPLDIARCLFFDLVSTMIKATNSANLPLNNTFFKETRPIEKLLNCKSVVDMRRELVEILRTLSNYIKKDRIRMKNKGVDSKLAADVAEYVRQNYADANLGVTSIAENYNIHIVYLSRAFKEQTGEGLADYINKVRIEKAKALLREMDTVEDVSSAVGYNNIRTFMRVFKKVEGITPGKYREIGS